MSDFEKVGQEIVEDVAIGAGITIAGAAIDAVFKGITGKESHVGKTIGGVLGFGYSSIKLAQTLDEAGIGGDDPRLVSYERRNSGNY